MKVIPRRKRDDEQRTGTMTVVEHLEELRHRIIVCLYAVAVGSVFGWLLYPHFMSLIRAPFCDRSPSRDRRTLLFAHSDQYALASRSKTRRQV